MIPYFIDLGSAPMNATVTDLNKDGRIDIVVTNYGTNSITILLGYGNGSFVSLITYSVGVSSWSWEIVITDFNNESQSDIAVVSFNNNSVGVILGFENGSFTAVVLYSAGGGSDPEGVAVGDFNNDIILDIAFANVVSNDMVVLYGFEDGSFLLDTAYSSGLGAGSVAINVTDLNNHTRLDLIVANYLMNNIGVFLGYGYEPFSGVTKYTTGYGSQPNSVAVADFNKDGWSDIVVINSGTDDVTILLDHGMRRLPFELHI